MKTYDVQHIEIDAPVDRAFSVVADSSRLPEWTNAFVSVDGDRALLRTPGDEVTVDLEVVAHPAEGTIDWRMIFPDGSSAIAYSRLVPAGDGRTVLTFVLLPPPAVLEGVERGLEQQSQILAQELRSLKTLVENSVAN